MSRTTAIALQGGLVLGLATAVWALVVAADIGFVGLLATCAAIAGGVLLASLLLHSRRGRQNRSHRQTLAIVASGLIGGLALSRRLQERGDATLATALAFAAGFVIAFSVTCLQRASRQADGLDESGGASL